MAVPESSLGVRQPRVESLGVSYRHGLMNVVLSKVRPCDEESVIRRIDNILKGYRRDLWKAEYACQHRLGVDFSPSGGIESAMNSWVSRQENETRNSLFCRPVHATLLGRYHLATVFRSTGFGMCHAFGTIDQILSQQVILGDIPVQPTTFHCHAWRNTSLMSFWLPIYMSLCPSMCARCPC